MKKMFMAVIALMMTISASAQFYLYCSDGKVIKVDSISMIAPADEPDTPVEPEEPDTPTEPEEPTNPSAGIGVFSVGEGKQVTFSKGNLQYHPANNVWQFAENQTDYIGDANNNCSSTYDGWLDLFGWSTATTNFGVSTSTSGSDYSGSFVDWGTNTIGNDKPNTWRTLSYYEWSYLLNTRTNASDLRGVAQVNGVNGLIFLPDNWVCPEGITFKSGFHSEYSVEAYGQYQTFTAEQWSKLEAAGAVFLPAAGRRDGSVVSYVQFYGNYWSASESDSDDAYSRYFDSAEAYMLYGNRNYGRSVRLVKDIEGGGATPDTPDTPDTPTEPEEPTNPSVGIGTFSVSADKQVTFSKGNLQYTQSTDTWSFASTQWEMIGTDNVTGGSVSSDPKYGDRKEGTALADKVDLFGWSTNATNFGVSTSTDYDDYYGSFVDWGTNKIGNDAPNTWRTLTNDEWYYLRYTRTNADTLCGVAQVNGVNGLILLPDSWTCPSGVTFKSGFYSEWGVKYYATYQTFTAAEWSKLESAGAVFLPASGDRFGSNVFGVQLYGVQLYGGYWSATEYNSHNAYYLHFDSEAAGMYDDYRGLGQSVRLVKDVEGENIDPEQPGAGEEPEEPSNPEEAYTHISKNLTAIKEAGDLYMVGDAEDKSWTLEVLIEDYTDYGTYDDIIGIYTDASGEYDIIGSGTFGYNEELSSNIFEGTMQTEDGALVLNVLMYYLDDRVPIPIIIKGATFEYNGNSPLYINGTWNDGEIVHTIMFECLEGLLIDKTDTEVQMLLDGGPMQGGSFAQSKDAIITKDGDILTLKGQFERYADGTLFDVTVTNNTVESGVEDVVVNSNTTKTIKNIR